MLTSITTSKTVLKGCMQLGGFLNIFGLFNQRGGVTLAYIMCSIELDSKMQPL